MDMGSIKSASHNEPTDSAAHFKEIKKLLCDLKSAFIRWAIIEAKGVVPGELLTIEVSQKLEGEKGLLQVVFHGNKYGCSFTPTKGKQIYWENYEADSLDTYEEIVFSIRDY
jgi:hypothetical protein